MTSSPALLLDARADREQGVERGAGVGRVEVVAHGHRLVAHRAEQGRAVGDRLVGRRRELPRSGPAGLESLGVRHARATGKPSAPIRPSARAAWSSPAIHSVMAPERMSGRRRERHVDDVHPCPSERQRHLRDDTGAVGDGQAQARERRPRADRPPAAAGGARGRRRSSRSPARRRRPAACPPPRAGARRWRRSRPRSPRGWPRRCRSRSRSWRPPRAWRRGSWARPAAPRRGPAACATSTLASTCGRWLTAASRRSWASASIATGRAPRALTSRCRRS